MATYLLTWNPKRFAWESFSQDLRTLREQGELVMNWSCGNTKRIVDGDRLFLIRQGKEDPGLVASGFALSGPYEDTHWEDQAPTVARKALYVDIVLDWLSAPPIITREELRSAPFDQVNWGAQGSGISINAYVARTLEQVWGQRIGSYFEPAPDEITDSDYPEGAATRITVNAYERNAKAREACVAHYGCKCFVCGTNLEERYGEIAHGLIHVHHLRTLSELGRAYSVDPIADLRPLCPNCHAVAHRREPPVDPEELKSLLSV